MRRVTRLSTALAAVLLASAVLSKTASACPNCKEAVSAQPSEVAGMARGFNYSVVFMVCMPFAMIGTGAFVVVRAARNGAFPEL